MRDACIKSVWPVVIVIVIVLTAFSTRAETPIHYTFTFPQPEHRWMQVEASFPDIGDRLLELRMSRSSPGRYSLHDFAKNVYDVHAYAKDGRELATARPDASGWDVSGHGGSVTVKYKVYGDRLDGTYLAVDETHAHINMPAAIMWGRGFDDRPSTLTFVPPEGVDWRVATQLHPTSAPFEFTAPNLQYLMDSPAELGGIVMRQFAVGPRIFRFAVHHTGSDADVDGYIKDVEKIVRVEGAIFGEFPEYEPGAYTFLADYLPYASGDGMEHRNSTVMTSSGSIARDRRRLLDTVAHEFFHCWNVERIRPRDLEPFDFDRANMSAELWLAEGFTQYYGPLAMQRAGIIDLARMSETLTGLVETATLEPGRSVRSAIDMSQMAPFIDGSRTIDRTDWPNTVISYYPLGAAIALAMDLSLRGRSGGNISLDDFMRSMWRKFGKPGGAREGYVDRPYTLDEVEATLADVSHDASFAHDFFARYIAGREAVDYAPLLARAGLVLRKTHPNRAWWGDLRFEAGNDGLQVSELVPANSPVYAAGLEQDDEIRKVGKDAVKSVDDVEAILGRLKPGDRVQIEMSNRAGDPRSIVVTMAADPHVEVVPVETIGGQLTAAEKAFRDRWFGPPR